MTKYLIENKDGEWLCNPDSEKIWTTDPNEAWQFSADIPGMFVISTPVSVVSNIIEESPDFIDITEHEYEGIHDGYHIWKHTVPKDRWPGEARYIIKCYPAEERKVEHKANWKGFYGMLGEKDPWLKEKDFQ